MADLESRGKGGGIVEDVRGTPSDMPVAVLFSSAVDVRNVDEGLEESSGRVKSDAGGKMNGSISRWRTVLGSSLW